MANNTFVTILVSAVLCIVTFLIMEQRMTTHHLPSVQTRSDDPTACQVSEWTSIGPCDMLCTRTESRTFYQSDHGCTHVARQVHCSPSECNKGGDGTAESSEDSEQVDSAEEDDDIVHQLLHLGSRPGMKLNRNSPPLRLWHYTSSAHTSDYCVSVLNSVVLDHCFDNHIPKQSWYFPEDFKDGIWGIDLPDQGEMCMTGEKDKPIRLTVCSDLSGSKSANLWTPTPGVGMVHKESGQCVTLRGYLQTPILKQCGDAANQWILPVDIKTLQPVNLNHWLRQMAKDRDAKLQVLTKELNSELNAILKLGFLSGTDKVKQDRRAQVFFAEARQHDIVGQVRWWLKAWQDLKLNDPDQAMDVLIFGDQKVFDKLRDFGCEDKVLSPSLKIPAKGSKGVCWTMQFVGIRSRVPGEYDGWFNSIEVMCNNETVPILSQYDNLLRADADTFPLPGMRNYWEKQIYFGRNAGYSTAYARSKLALASEYAGMKYLDEGNIASTYYGPSQDVINVARLTVAVGRYLRVFSFSPGSGCRLPKRLRPADLKCEWGSGLYEGVALLYSQEVAVNHLLSAGLKAKMLKNGYFDIGTAGDHDVCKSKMLHVYHGDDRFSKFAFNAGKYKQLDMVNFQLHRARDFATYFALTANSQGKNGDTALESVKKAPHAMCG